MRLRRPVRAAAWAVLGMMASGCAGPHPQTTFKPVSAYGALQNVLFYNTFWWTMLVLAIVWGALLVIIFRFREKPGAPEPAHIHGNTTLEILWTIGPALIVAFIAVPTIRAIFELEKPAPANALQIEVIGHQWWWEFRYPQYGNIVTANEVRLIQGRPVDFIIHSADVVHSFWIPRLGGKRDVNPQPTPPGNVSRRVNHIVLTPDSVGVYRGQCAEYCGSSHADMRVRAVVQTAADFNSWVTAFNTPVEPPAGSLAAQGKEIFQSHMCIACHTVKGTTAMGQLGPNLTLVGSRETIAAGILPTSVENLERWITHPAGVKPGALMPGIREGAGGMPATGLTPDQVRAVATYLASLRPAGAAGPGTPAAPAAVAPNPAAGMPTTGAAAPGTGGAPAAQATTSPANAAHQHATTTPASNR